MANGKKKALVNWFTNNHIEISLSWCLMMNLKINMKIWGYKYLNKFENFSSVFRGLPRDFLLT